MSSLHENTKSLDKHFGTLEALFFPLTPRHPRTLIPLQRTTCPDGRGSFVDLALCLAIGLGMVLDSTFGSKITGVPLGHTGIAR